MQEPGIECVSDYYRVGKFNNSRAVPRTVIVKFSNPWQVSLETVIKDFHAQELQALYLSL